MCSINGLRRDERLDNVITPRKNHITCKIEYNKSSRKNEYDDFVVVRVTEQQRVWGEKNRGI